MTAILRGIRSVNRLIVRERAPETLIQRVADALVEARALVGACIVRTRGGEIVQRATAGQAPGLSPLFERLARGELPSCMARALAGESVLHRRFEPACPGCPLADPPLNGLDALAVPIEHEGRRHGAFLALLPEGGSSNTEEIDLFSELASDIGLALQTIEQSAALRESERRYRLVTESVSDVIWVLDLETTRFTYVSPSIERLRGYSVEEVLSQAPHEVLTAESAARMFGTLPDRIAAFEKGIVESFIDEVEQPCKDGSTVWVEANTHLARDEATGHILVYGTTRNIDDRRRAERALRESEDRFRHALEEIPDVIVIYDPDLRIRYINGATRRLTGRPTAEYMGKRDQDMWPPEICETWLPTLQRARDLGVTESVEVMLDLATGARALTITCIPLLDDGGRVREIVAVTHDATPRYEAERVLRERLALQGQLASVAESVPGLVHSFRIDASGTGRMLFTTPAIEDVFGISQESVAKDTTEWAKRIDRGDMRRVLTRLDESVRNRAPWHDEYRYHHPKKGLRWIEGWSVPKLLPDGEYAWHGFVMDITDKKRTEQSLRELADELEVRVHERTAELARAARAKDDFLASMSHELRTPLNGILGLSEILEEEEDVYGSLNDKQRRAIGRIRESGRHLLSLINDILDVAKIESGKLELDLGAVDVGDVCRASLRLVQEPALKKRIEVGISIREGMPRVIADERRLKQVLVNLLTNAVKFTPAGGSVELEADVVEGTGAFRITVSDTGVGITEADALRLFQPFVQLDSRLSRKHAGTGLGLALVRRLVELHGGRVTLTSEPGAGSRFTVTMPIRPAKSDDADAGMW